MIKLVRLTARLSHVCRHPARPPDHLPVSYYLADAALSACPSAVCPPVRSLAVAALVAVRHPLRRSPALSTSPIDCPSPVRRYQVASQIPAESSCDRLSPLFPWSLVDVSGSYLSTCCLMKMAAASSLECIHMKSAHRFCQPSVTVEINFFWC